VHIGPSSATSAVIATLGAMVTRTLSVWVAKIDGWIHSDTVDKSPDVLASRGATQPAVCLTCSKEMPCWVEWNREFSVFFSLEVKEDVREVANWLYATSAKYPVTRFRCGMQFSCYSSACDVTLLPRCLITSGNRCPISHLSEIVDGIWRTKWSDRNQVILGRRVT
jgi:hypothetical protein